MRRAGWTTEPRASPSRFLIWPLFSDGAGGAEGPSHPHLTVDSDRQHHRRSAAVGADHFHPVEGIFTSRLPSGTSLRNAPLTNVLSLAPVDSSGSSHANREERTRTTRTEARRDAETVLGWRRRYGDHQDRRGHHTGPDKMHNPLFPGSGALM